MTVGPIAMVILVQHIAPIGGAKTMELAQAGMTVGETLLPMLSMDMMPAQHVVAVGEELRRSLKRGLCLKFFRSTARKL